jgi:hypothetical protein
MFASRLVSQPEAVMRAQPKVNFYTQVNLAVDERRRRIQARTGYPLPRLVDEALRVLELSLDDNGASQSASETRA